MWIIQIFFTWCSTYAVIYITLLLSTETLLHFCCFVLFFILTPSVAHCAILYVYHARARKLAPYGSLILSMCVTIHVRFMRCVTEGFKSLL